MNSDNFNVSNLNNEIWQIDCSDLQSHLKVQLEEVEILQATYYKDKEFLIDALVVSEVDQYIREVLDRIPPLIEFSINLVRDDVSLEIQVSLPRTYPTTEPQIIMRSNQLNRQQQDDFNNNLKHYIENLDRGNICVYECISWVTDNLSKYYQTKTANCVTPHVQQNSSIFSRYWIYSHHIYSKEKRKDITSLARKYHITGFCLSGKPGIICAEGLDADCEEWWQQIKSMTWKKIICKKKEEFDLPDDESSKTFSKFQEFSEISFQNLKNNSRETHTDMGKFYRYLLKHDCGYIFKDYFGIDGKTTK